MNILKKIAGKILDAVSQLISIILDALIAIIEFAVILVNTIGRGLISFIGLGGCLIFFLLGPFGIFLLMNPIVLFSLLLFVIFPILGTKFVSYLKYVKYMLTEYLFDYASYLIHGKNKRFASFAEYGNKYRKAEEARKRKEQQERQAEQQRIWEERFRQWAEYQNAQRGYTGYGSYGGYGSYDPYGQGRGYNGHSYSNPVMDFKRKYEQSCDLLGVKYDADKYQIKLAYRKKAKEHHPDVNNSPDATKMFQQINDAYEFLNEDNMERYKSLKQSGSF